MMLGRENKWQDHGVIKNPEIVGAIKVVFSCRVGSTCILLLCQHEGVCMCLCVFVCVCVCASKQTWIISDTTNNYAQILSGVWSKLWKCAVVLSWFGCSRKLRQVSDSLTFNSYRHWITHSRFTMISNILNVHLHTGINANLKQINLQTNLVQCQ